MRPRIPPLRPRVRYTSDAFYVSDAAEVAADPKDKEAFVLEFFFGDDEGDEAF